MNPAFSIWAWALSVCAVVTLCLAMSSGLVLFIFLLVAIASVGSLLGFYLLYELLRHLQLAQVSVWIYAALGTTSIVAFNAFCLLLFLEDRSSITALIRLFQDLIPVILIPLAGAIIGMLASFKKINAYCKPTEQAYYPDACI